MTPTNKKVIRNELHPANTKKNSGIVTEACASWLRNGPTVLAFTHCKHQFVPVVEGEHGERTPNGLPEIIEVVKGLFDLERLDRLDHSPNRLYCGCFMGYLTLQPILLVAFGPQIVLPDWASRGTAGHRHMCYWDHQNHHT